MQQTSELLLNDPGFPSLFKSSQKDQNEDTRNKILVNAASGSHTDSGSALPNQIWVTKRKVKEPLPIISKKKQVQKINSQLSSNQKKRYTQNTTYRDSSFIREIASDRAYSAVQNTKWKDPLPHASWSVPVGKYHPGGFAFVRKQSVHTGVDLYCSVGTKVAAVEAGKVVAIEYFTGPEAGCAWYNTTMAVLVEGPSGVVLYGEIEPDSTLKIGTQVSAGQCLGSVLAVLKQNKGNGTSMLHMELYRKGTKTSVWWEHGNPQPSRLLNPTNHLLAVITSKTLNPLS